MKIGEVDPSKSPQELATDQWVAECEKNPKYPGGHYPLVYDSFDAGAKWGIDLAKKVVEDWLSFYRDHVKQAERRGDSDLDMCRARTWAADDILRALNETKTAGSVEPVDKEG